MRFLNSLRENVSVNHHLFKYRVKHRILHRTEAFDSGDDEDSLADY